MGGPEEYPGKQPQQTENASQYIPSGYPPPSQLTTQASYIPPYQLPPTYQQYPPTGYPPQTTGYPPPPPQTTNYPSYPISNESEPTKPHHHHVDVPENIFLVSPNEAALRQNAFIAKVLTIVTSQLILCALVSGFVYAYAFDFVQSVSWLWWVALIFEFIFLFILQAVRKKTPHNFIVLILFTLSTSWVVATIVTFYDIPTIIEAVVLTISTTVLLIAYVLITKSDFRWLGSFLFCAFWIIFWWCLITFVFFPYGWFGPSPVWWVQMISLIFVIIFIGFILYDISKLVHTYDHSEYIFAAVDLYLDIINLFLCLLQLIGVSGGSRN